MFNSKNILVLFFLLSLFPNLVRAGESDPEADQYFPLHGDFAASHILISYKNADRAKPEVTRSKKEAEAFARELADKLAADPSQFDELASLHSDGPTRKVAGNLKTFPKGAMAPPFEKALVKLADGEITREPVKTQFGFHIIRRNPMSVKNYSANALVITFKDAVRVKGIRDDAPGLNRTREEALAYLEQLAPSVTSANFESSLEKGDFSGTAFMGVFKTGDGAMSDLMIEAIRNLEYGAVSGITELPIGFVLLRRNRVEQRAGSRIWLKYVGGPEASDSVTRSLEEARTLATDLCARLASNSASFEDLSRKFSDGPFAVRGGNMAMWFAGYQEPAFEAAYEKLAPGQISSEPVETPSGIFIIKRK